MMNTMVADALVGRTVDGRYRVESRLAAGGMATVYQATDLRLDRPVALKVMKSGIAQDPEFVSRFQSEARAAARLSDPHVVAVFDQGTADGLVYLAMEYVPGRTLRDILHDHGPLAPEQALAVMDQALQALAAAHDAGFVHRDVKPENVLVADNGAIKVTDFGLARALETPSSLTQGQLIGTAAYLAPEQVSEGESDERSDVYQAGVLLFELLTGSAPHTGDTPWAVAYQHVNTDVPHVRSVRPDVPRDLDALVRDATARDRNRRISSVPEFLARVRRIALTLPPPQPLPVRPPVVVPDSTTARFDERPPELLAGVDGDGPAEAAAPSFTGEQRSWRVGALVVGVLVVIAALAGWFTANGNPFDRTDVPTVVGATEAKAMAALSGSGFQPEVTERVFSEKVAAGIVVSSDPEQGSSAQTGAAVDLVVSLGPERYDVPKVKGQTPEEAAATLAATNLRAGETRDTYHDSVEEGLVVNTDPARGTQVKRDATITLLVSKGPAPVKVPNLAGESEQAARTQLEDLGLKATTVEEESASVPKGAVIHTSPKQGTTLHRGDSIELVVSSGPPPVEMPNVVDQPRAEAIRQLEALGLKVKIDEGIVTPLDRVYSQDPPPGTEVPVGNTVTLSVF